jgi:Fe-S oxidoreductase
VQDLVGLMNTNGTRPNLHGDTIAAETLWSCTTCGACADVCPLGISPMRMITDMRRNLIGEGALRGSPAVALQKTDRAGNPWGLSPADRFAWAAGLDVPLAGEHADFEVLYWVGCAAAYDRRVQKVACSFVRLLQAAKVNFAVLGPEERCTGESARRMGDELLFQQLAAANVETLGRRGVRRIVAHCPHCVNSLRNDYPQSGGNYEVLHHSQLLAELIEQGRLGKRKYEARMTNDESSDSSSVIRQSSLTYHDPCYLARANGVTEPPRAVLAAAASPGDQLHILELPRNRCQTSCCGGGGGRMWFDDSPAQRVGQGRVREIAESGADTVAVSCPFCLIMLGDGLAATKPEVRVRDIAEVLADAVLGPDGST